MKEPTVINHKKVKKKKRRKSQ